MAGRGSWVVYMPPGEGQWRATRRHGGKLQVVYGDSRARLEQRMAQVENAEGDREINKAPPPGAWASMQRKERNELRARTRPVRP